MNPIIILLSILLLTLSALFSGLNLGILSLNVDELKRKAQLGNKNAKKLYPIRKKGNLLLCTLLIGNVAVNAALSILLGTLLNGFIAGIIATTLIVIFGEIVPQATISRHALTIAARTLWITKFFIFVLYPFSYPLSYILDKFLGDELPQIWSKDELKEIIKFHEDSPSSNIDEDEERIVLGALSFSHKTVEEIMTPRTMVFCLEKKTIIDEILIKKISNDRHTRIPVYEGRLDNIIGIVNIKDLLGIKLPCMLDRLIKTDNVIRTNETTKLDIVLNKFLATHSHIAFVYDGFAGLSGIVTLEDVVEEIIQTEVYDEGEAVADPREMALKRAITITR